MKAVFLDRDGVINRDRDDYVKNVRELKIFPQSPTAIARLTDAGWPVFVVSNQQGIAKGLISEEDLQEMQAEITRQVSAAGGSITAFYYCKHLDAENCGCRKPQPGLLLQAARENDIELAESIMIGDSERDIAAGKRAGCKTILVLTGKLTREDAGDLEFVPDYIAEDLAEAADYIVSQYD